VTAGPWLVTGASGFLGRHLLTDIESAGTERAVALIRSDADWRAMDWTARLTRTETLLGSVTSPLERSGGLGGIFHLAGLVRHSRRDADEVYRTNVEGTLNMVRLAAANRCRLIFVSTSGTVACFRDPEATADEAAPYVEAEVERWPYYRSKIQAEVQARRLAAELSVDLVIVRPPVLLGPEDHRFRSTNYVTRFLRGRMPFLIRGGMHFADVRDAAAALRRAMLVEQPRAIYHLPGAVQDIAAFFRVVAEVSHRPPPARTIPYPMAHLLARLTAPLSLLPDPVVVEMAAHYWRMHSRYAESGLAYRSRAARDTIADTVAWLLAHHPRLRP
jgi:dihydroflavonol-4-reductase